MSMFNKRFIIYTLVVLAGTLFYARKRNNRLAPNQIIPSIIPKEHKENAPQLKLRKKDEIMELSALQIDKNGKETPRGKQPLKKFPPMFDKQNKSYQDIGERKTTLNIIPGPEVLDHYKRNQGNIQQTLKDFKDNPSFKAKLTVPF